MHNLSGRMSAMLETFSGTVTVAQPHDLPEGASPRCQNVDFSVGSVFTRQGLVNPFTYSGNSAGPSNGGSAEDTSLGGSVWANPGNALLDTGVYATANILGPTNTSPTPTMSSAQWLNPSYATSSSLYTVGSLTSGTLVATVSGLAIPTNSTITGVSVNFNAYYSASNGGKEGKIFAYLNLSGTTSSTEDTGLMTLAPVSYGLGSSTDLWGVNITPTILNAGFTVNFTVGVTGIATGFTYGHLNNLVITVYYQQNNTDGLDIKQFSFSIPATATPQGLIISINGYASETCTLNAQLLKAGTPIGNIESVSLNVGSVTTLTLGGINDLFGASWNYADLNNTAFGVRITATSSTSCRVYVGYTTIKAYFLPTLVNFNYITTYEDNFGNIYNVALDADGDFWIEYASTNPGVLVSLFTGIPSGSFASSFTANSRQYVAISDLLHGNYPPQQIIGTSSAQAGWNDRVSQVGPGAAPSFTGTLTTSGQATITAYSYSSGILTLTASNEFTAGEVVVFAAGSTDALYALNGLSFNVLGTGLSTSAFEISSTLVTSASGTSTATASGQYTYSISSIVQKTTQPYAAWDGLLWSAGPGSTSSGNVITVYYGRSIEDTVLDQAFTDGLYSVYVYITGAGIAVANGTHLVTAIGVGTPPGASTQRHYFTFSVSSSSYKKIQSGDQSAAGYYQMTIATLTTDLPLPGVQVGDSVTIAGASVNNWNNTWKILNALNSGSYAITATSMTSGVATYTWELSGSTTVAPQVGQLVTVTGTLNGNLIFNVTDAEITSVTGTTSGTFKVSGFADETYSSEVEVGQATTSGTEFQIDPGTLTLGSSTANPIYGNSTGGTITLIGSSSVVVSTGTRKGTVFFITRNGYWTAPAPPVEFTITENVNYILVSNIPVGPSDIVVGRGIAFTEAGQEGQPGASYYTIPTPVSYVYNTVTYLSSALIINDNTTTTAKFTFPDSVLLNAEEIDIQGNNLFNLGELGDAAWCTQYAGRSVWGRVRNKIQNFLNLTFDGGYTPNPGSNLVPLGWGLDSTNNNSASLPTLLSSPIYGNSFYIKNQTGSTQSALGMIIQTAYEDWNNVAILQNQTQYSVRLTCRTPASSTVGSLVIDLTAYNSGSGYGQTYGSYTLPVSSMNSAMATYEGTLLTTDTLNIPDNLYLRVWASGLAAGADIEIDRIEIFPTIEPTNLTQLVISYENDLESFDQVTGGVDTTTTNTQPANGAFVLHDELYVVKESSLGYVADSTGQEPANWNPYREVSNVAGACGINAYDVGEEWAVMGCQNGLFLFNGGQPTAIQLEIPDIWAAINWPYAYTMCIRNDVANRRILIAAPMATPNQWCPDFEENSNPTTPNVVLMLNYEGIGSIEDLMNASPIHVTMTGRLAVHDIRRKWSLWSISTPYIGLCKRSELFSEMLFCNGIQSSKIYALGSYELGADDGKAFPSSYCTYGFVSQNKADENPAFGKHNKRYVYYDLLISGNGSIAGKTLAIEFYQNVLKAPHPFIVPGGVTLSSPATNDTEGSLDEFAQRLFIEISSKGAGDYFNLSRVTLVAAADNWAPLRGV